MPVELEEQMAGIEAGGHLCLFYEKDPAEQMPALVPFIKDGIARNEQIIYVVADQTVAELSCHLKAAGVDVAAETKSGRLKLYTRDEWRQSGPLDSAKKTAQVDEVISQAREQGFKGLRLAVEMTWATDPDVDVGALEQGEAKVNVMFSPAFPVRVICQYNRERLNPEMLIAALHTHALVMVGQSIYPNPFFEAPLILNGNGHGCCDGRHSPAKPARDSKMAYARLNWMLSQLQHVRNALDYRAQNEDLRRRNEQLKQAEEALKQSREHLRAIIENTPECVKIVAPDGTLLDMNAAGCRMVIAKHSYEVIGKSIYELIAHEDRQRYQAMNERVCQGAAETLSFQIIDLGGNRHFMESHAVPLRDPHTGKYNQLAITRDVTDQKASQDAWRFLSAVVESSDDAIITKNLNGIITSWNRGAERIFGYAEKEAIGQPVSMLIPEDRQNEEPGILAKLRKGQRIDHYETIRRRKDGQLMDISLTVSPVRNEEGKIIAASKIARDISLRRRTEEALRESDARFRALIDNSPIPIWVKDCAGAYVLINKRYEEVFHITEREIYGKTDFDFFPPNVARKFRQNDVEVLQSGMPIEVEDTVPLKEGLHTYICVKFPLRKLDGTIYAIAGMATDITARKLAEHDLNEARDRLARVNENLEKRVEERTASLRQMIAQMEEFSYSVSHDLRAPVRAMRGYAEAALEDYGERIDARGRDYLDRIVRGSTRMERLIHDVLTYSRLARSEANLQPVSLQTLVADIVQQYPSMQQPHAEITIRDHLHCVIAHEPSLTQAISNLLSNGVKFVARDTTPKIQIWSEKRDESGYIRLWIEDNGIGVKPEYQHRLFGMFERVHQEEQYDGTGIGLAIVRKAVEKMGGRTGVESDGLTGSSFWIELPPAS